MNNVKKLKIIGFLSELYFYTPIFTLYLLNNSIGLETIIFAQILYSIGSLVGEIPTGYFADKYGDKQAVVLGLLLDMVGMLLLFISPSLSSLVAFFLIRGVSGAFLSGSTEALLYESHTRESIGKETYQQAYGRYLSNGILAFITATLVAGVLVQVFGVSSYRPIIFMTALASLSALGVALTVKNFRAKSRSEAAEIKFIKHTGESMAIVRSERTVRALTLVALLTVSAEYFLRQSYQPLFESAGVMPLFLGLSLTIGSALNYLIVRNSYRLEKYLTLDKILLLHNLLMAFGFGLMALFLNPYVLVGAYILLQGLFNAQRPIVSDYVNERIGPEKRSTVLSTISFGQSLMSILTRLLLAASLGWFGLQNTLGLQAVYLVVGISIGYWYMRRCGCVHRINKHDETACLENCPETFGAAQGA